MDMPIAMLEEAAQSVSIGALASGVADLAPVVEIVRHTWSTQTLAQISEGRVTVPDEVINESLARYAGENQKISDIRVASLGDGRLRLTAKTEKLGAVDFLCRIDQLRHDKDISLLKFTVLEKDLPDQEVLSWIVSRVSLSMVEKMVGHIEFGDTVKTKITGDTVAIDFHDALAATPFGKANLFGYRLGDALVIEEATPKEGYIECKTALKLPDGVKQMVQNILK